MSFPVFVTGGEVKYDTPHSKIVVGSILIRGLPVWCLHALPVPSDSCDRLQLPIDPECRLSEDRKWMLGWRC